MGTIRQRHAATALVMAMAALVAICPGLGLGVAEAAGGYNYTLVRQFTGTGTEALVEYALNDKGQVVYLTSQPTSSGGNAGTLYSIHLWVPAANPLAPPVDTVIYAATAIASTTGQGQGNALNAAPVPVPPAFLTEGGSLAISNSGVVSVEALIPQGPQYSLILSNNGYVNIDTTALPSLPLPYTISYVAGFLDTQSKQVSEQPITSVARAVVNLQPNAFGPVLPAPQVFNGPPNVNPPAAVTEALDPLGAYSVGWFAFYAGGDTARSYPVINHSGQVTALVVSGAGGPAIADLAPGALAPTITPFGDATWSIDGRVGLNSRGEAAFLVGNPFRVALMPAQRTSTPRILTDSTVFPLSVPVQAVSLSDWDEVMLQTQDQSAYAGIWSVAADGFPVEVYSGLDPTLYVYNPVTGTTTNLSPCGNGNSCAGNGSFWFQSGSVDPYSEISTNNHGSVIFVTAIGASNTLLIANPSPGLRPSVPVMPDAQDPSTNLMTFLAPCVSLYQGSGFLTPALAMPAGSFAGTCYVDPVPAAGYTLTAAAGADNFQSVIVPAALPSGQSAFVVNYVVNGAPTSAPLIAGAVYKFPVGGVQAFTITGINAAENLSPNDPSAFVLGLTWVNMGSAPTGFTMVPLVDAGPTVNYSISGTPGNGGWYTSNVTVSWVVSDALEPITNQTGCGSTTISTDTAGQTVTCTASTVGGTTTQSVTVKRDATPPVALATSSPVPDAAGWNNSTVTVAFSGTDTTSGIAGCSAPVLVTTQGANQASAAGTCTDNAGNVSAPVSAQGINIDETPPVVSDVITAISPPSASGWYTAPVTVAFAATDALSGVAPGACSVPVVLSSSGAGQVASGTCTNLAGDVGTLTVSGINIDLTTPVAAYTATPPRNAAGWNDSPVTVTFSGTDSLSGSGIAGCTGPVTVSTSGAGQLATGTCASVAGTVSAPVTDSVNIDLVPPVATIYSPVNNEVYPSGVPIGANYTCRDGLSGIAAGGCAGATANGAAISANTPGPQTFLVTATDNAGNTATMSDAYVVSPLTLAAPGIIWTYAGDGQAGFGGDGGQANAAAFGNPNGIAVDSAGNLFIVDQQNQVIRRVDAVTGVITTVAGTAGTRGYAGDGGPATSATLNLPINVAVDTAGNLFIADQWNHAVRRVDAATGVITTVAGTGTAGFAGDTGLAAAAQLYYPAGIAIDGSGNLYIADQYNERIRRVAASTRIISTIAGNGSQSFAGDGGPATAAALNHPATLAVDTAGNLYIADQNNHRVRKVAAATGVITTIAGNGSAAFSGDGGPATLAAINFDFGVAVDGLGNVYIGDQGNNRVRRVDAVTQIITTIAGTGSSGFTGDGGPATAGELNFACCVAIDGGGRLYISDLVNQRVRVVSQGSTPPDTTPPVITPSISGTLGNNGWYTSNVAVTWVVADPLAPVISQTGCDPTTISADTTGQTVTCAAVGQGGSATQSVTIKRDATPPVANAIPSPVPNGNGWNSSTVTVTFAGTDSTSGIASCSAPVSVTTQGANQTSPAGSCTDNAGNVSASVSVANINIDETAPVVSASPSPAPNGNGWNNTAVTVTFAATDALSGVAANGCQGPVVVSANGAAQSVTGSCSDKAGNAASATVTGINVDTIAPTAVATATPAPNAAGWNNTGVSVAFSGTDNLSGSGIASCSPGVVLATAGAGQAATGTCADRAGNTSAPATKTVNIDATPPSVSITTPANGASYASGSVVTAAYGCTDALSGVASCSGTAANGAPINTSAAGSYGFSVAGTDVAGNSATASVSYTVVTAAAAYTLAPGALTFGGEPVGSPSGPLSITLTSTGTAPLSVTGIGLTGANPFQFSTTNNCGTTVAPGASCTISVVFRPTTTGAKSASISVNGGAAGTRTVLLSGTGVDATYTVSSGTVAFGNQAVDSPTAAQAVVVSNTGSVPLPLTGIGLTGANPGQFSETTTCGSSLATGTSCTISVVFRPTSAGAKTAAVRVGSGGGAAAQAVALSGTGIVPSYSLNPTSVAFGSQARRTTSAAQAVTLTNSGSLPVPLNTISIGGANPGQFSQSNDCGTSVAVGGTCTISIVFAPTSSGGKTATLRISAGGGATTLTAALSGTGT